MDYDEIRRFSQRGIFLLIRKAIFAAGVVMVVLSCLCIWKATKLNRFSAGLCEVRP